MSLGMEDRQTKSFWQRPEGTTGMLALAAGGVGLFFAAPALLAFVSTMVSLVGQTIVLVGLGTILFAMLYVLTNKKFQTLVSYMFKSAMRKITGAFVEIDPIGIMKSYIQDLHKKRESLGENRDKLKGQLVVLTRTINENTAKTEKAMSIASVAQREGNASQVSVQGRQAIRLEKLNKESLGPLKMQIEIHLRALNKYYEVTGTVIEDLKNEVDAREIERKMILASSSAIKSAKAILAGGTDERELFDQAMEFVVEDYGMKLGEIESFIENSKGFVDGLDMQNMAYEAEALKRLQEWEKKADSVLLGNEKAKMLEHTAVSGPLYTSVGVPAAGTVDYAQLLSKK
jgi:hypothetical protein